ncbi:MAG: hypothetical protein LBU88_08250 [Treponema sp.]|jgi:hypothetical protein|nr:hypothetical protein [Treponema sp.]
MKKHLIIVVLCAFIVNLPVFAQTHSPVPLGDQIYHILEIAQMRGLTGALPGVKPYSHAQVLNIIDKILDADLSDTERSILEQHKKRLSPPREGLDLVRGTISEELTVNDSYFSFEFGFGLDFVFSGGYYAIAGGYEYADGDPEQFKGASHAKAGLYTAIDIGIPLSFKGDLGKNTSYGLSIIGRIVKNPRAVLGRGHNIFWEYVPEDDPRNTHPLYRQVTIFGEPLAYFPYTYKRRWDGFVWPYDNLSSSSMRAWPYDLSVGYTMIPELSGTLLDNYVSYRIARIDREWAGITTGSSLVLNQAAQPFLGAELTITTPFEWFNISSLTGVLEFHNAFGRNPNSLNDSSLKRSSEVFQNAFSIVMLELDFKYVHFDVGTTSVWSKRFELAYPFPFAENLMTQNNLGDWDNMSLFFNIMGQYPSIGKVWFSWLMNEFNISEPNKWEKDRSMFIFQAGASVMIPKLPFTTITFSYTKNEPYNYTHTRENMPWYGVDDNGNPLLMETNYINFGKSLGHYIPPNSDEILVRITTMPLSNSMFSLQYQLIRHGADYGDRAVDGSSLWSELGGNRSSQPELRKYFLRDGAYQWMHIAKVRGEYSFVEKKWPFKVFAEIGGVYSYFTDIDSGIPPNSGEPNPYSVINTPQYPHQLYFIGTIGITIFPK